MSLVTRCPACTTMFKVVPDQIRIAAGWVRCGHCGEVFDASVHMLPYEQSVQAVRRAAELAPARVSTASAPSVSMARMLTQPSASTLPVSAAEPISDHPKPAVAEPPAGPVSPPVAAPVEPLQAAPEAKSDRADEPLPTLPAANPPPAPAPDAVAAQQEAPAPASPPVQRDAVPVESSSVDRALPVSEPADASAPARAGLSEPDEAMAGDVVADPAEAPLEPAGAEPAPSFVTEARRRAFWSSRPVRVLSWLAALLLLVALLLQVALSRRDWLAAREPQLAPALEALCQRLGCIVGPYRQLDAIVIDSSAFNRLSSNTFRFSISLRNTSDLPVASPALELTLTDGQDQVLVRRVVSQAELGAPRSLAAHGEFSGVNVLTVDDLANPGAVVGYRLTAFYP